MNASTNGHLSLLALLYTADLSTVHLLSNCKCNILQAQRNPKSDNWKKMESADKLTNQENNLQLQPYLQCAVKRFSKTPFPFFMSLYRQNAS